MAGGNGRLAWPFLIARGRRSGYQTLVCPEPLAADGAYGVLEREIEPNPDRDTPSTLELHTTDGRTFTAVHLSHVASAADLGAVDARDAHGRPLLLIFGLLWEQARVLKISTTDVDLAFRTALPAYRRFLADEDHYSLAVPKPFPTNSIIEIATPPAGTAGDVAAHGPRWQKVKPDLKIALAGLILSIITGIAVVGITSYGSGPEPPSENETLQCIKGNWRLAGFKNPEFDVDQSNNPQFSFSGRTLLIFGESGQGSLEVDRTVTTTYAANSGWAPIDDKMAGKVTFSYSVNADPATGSTLLSYSNEAGVVRLTSTRAGIEPKDETNAVSLVGRRVVCGSNRLTLESVDEKRMDIYQRT